MRWLHPLILLCLATSFRLAPSALGEHGEPPRGTARPVPVEVRFESDPNDDDDDLDFGLDGTQGPPAQVSANAEFHRMWPGVPQ